jgi:hypothetical protein
MNFSEKCWQNFCSCSMFIHCLIRYTPETVCLKPALSSIFILISLGFQPPPPPLISFVSFSLPSCFPLPPFPFYPVSLCPFFPSIVFHFTPFPFHPVSLYPFFPSILFPFAPRIFIILPNYFSGLCNVFFLSCTFFFHPLFLSVLLPF